MFAVGDRPPWTNRRPPETSGVPTLQQMFALAQRMGYEMRPISRQTDAPRQQPGGRSHVGQDRGFRSQPRTGRDYSKFWCFSCGQFGYMQSRCPVRRKRTERWKKSDGKLTLDRDLTHPGLHVHNSTIIHPSVIKSSWDSSSPNNTVARIIRIIMVARITRITRITRTIGLIGIVKIIVITRIIRITRITRITRRQRKCPIVHHRKYATGDKIGLPVSRLVGYNRRSAHRGGYFADIRGGTLVPRGMDRRSRGGLPGRFWIGGYSAIMQILPDPTECGSTGGSVTAAGQKTARCQWSRFWDARLAWCHFWVSGRNFQF